MLARRSAYAESRAVRFSRKRSRLICPDGIPTLHWHAIGAAGETAMVQTRLRAALIGVGAWGRVLAKAASQSTKIEFVCCVGRNAERLATFAGNTGIPTRPLDDVLADKDIAAVVLALPNELHFEVAQAAARAGNHIYIEKPIAN